ncbi:MAG: glycosyltransferase family 1 protein [Dehalococcoidia bacterium]
MSGSGPQRVGLNLLFLVPGETGGAETYARSLIGELSRLEGGPELVAFLNREGYQSLSNGGLGAGIEPVKIDVSGRSRLKRVVAEQVALPRWLRRHRIDLVHSLASTGPLRPGLPSVVTVLDVIYALHGEAHTLAMRTGMRLLVPPAARRAERVIAISHSAAAEIADELNVDPAHIDVTQLAGRPLGPATPEPLLRERLGLGSSPLVLSPSARRPHKNIGRLIEAFARVGCEPQPALVLPGYATGFEDELVETARRFGIADRIHALGWVTDEDLEGLFAAARCFVFPSLAEGFGLPVLEALERELPVACSKISSLPEVAGPAARYFDPYDVADIAAAIEQLLTDRELAGQLVEAGRVRASSFSWRRTAQQTLASYRRAWNSSAERAP